MNLKLDTRLARGARLTYFADDERYLMSGAGTKSVKVVEACRETTGRTLTFFKSTDRIIVDGNEEIRTQTRNGVQPRMHRDAAPSLMPSTAPRCAPRPSPSRTAAAR